MSASESRRLAREGLSGKWGKAVLTIIVYSVITFILNFLLGLVPMVGNIVTFIIEVPLAFGLIATLMKLKRGEEITYTDFLATGFSNFAGSWKVTLWTWVKMLLPIIVSIICIALIFVGLSVGIAQSAYTNGYTMNSLTTPEQLTAYLQNANYDSFGSTSIIMIVVGFIGAIVGSIWYTVKSYLFKPALFILFDNPDKTAKEVVEESANIMKGNRWKFFCLELSFIGWAILASCTCGIGMLWLVPYIIVAEVCFYEQLVGKSN